MTDTGQLKGYEAIVERAAFFQPNGGRFRLMGPEAQEYLHRMVTNDIKGLAPGQGTYACLLDINGRMIADLWAWVISADEILVETADSACEVVMATLDKYLIMEEVEIQDARAELRLVSIQGPRCRDVLARALATTVLPLAPGSLWQSSVDGSDLIVVARDRTGCGGFDVYVPSNADGLLNSLRETGVEEASEAAVQALRIEAGIAQWGAELTTDTIPLDAGLEGIAISFTKGCYPGQEIIARIHSRGKPARHLVGIRFESGLPPAGATVKSEGVDVGVITSSAASPRLGPIALAYLKKERGEPGVAVECDGIRGTTTALPFSASPERS